MYDNLLRLNFHLFFLMLAFCLALHVTTPGTSLMMVIMTVYSVAAISLRLRKIYFLVCRGPQVIFGKN